MPKNTFQTIALIGRAGKNIADTLDAVHDYLIQKKRAVLVEEISAHMMSKKSLNTFSDEKIPNEIDLMIVVGGDGSLLNAARLALPKDIPVLGINRGQLGFLTDIHPDHLEKIADVLNGKLLLEKRFLLQATLSRKILGMALNDVVLLPGDTAQLIEFDTLINGNLVCEQRADGMIIATPTGSTAYALSAGGPILHPQLNAIALVPMFPHTLSSRPIVVEGDARIELIIRESNETSPCISCDGQTKISVKPGDRIQIQKTKKSLRLIHPNDYDYYATLREKLGWQMRAR